MDRGRGRLLVLIALVILALTGCDDTGYSGPVYVTATSRLPSARELAAVETAQAEETRQAMQDVARATADALELERQATQQALDLRGTQEAQEANATREAWAFAQTQEAAAIQATATAETRIATATRQAIDATATAGHDLATATAGQWAANVQGTQAAADAFAVEATRRAVERADEREAVTQPLRAWWAWVLLALAIPALIWLGWRAAQVIEARGRVIRRKADEGEPVIVMTRDRMALPLRSFNALMSGDEIPALPGPEMQDAATMRQQTTNAIQARQVAATVKARKAHKAKPPQVVAQAARASRPAQRRRQIPGLIKVVSVGSLEEAAAQGILPPRLAETIEGKWGDANEED